MLTVGLYISIHTAKTFHYFLGHPFKTPAKINVDYTLSVYLSIHQDYVQNRNLQTSLLMKLLSHMQ